MSWHIAQVYSCLFSSVTIISFKVCLKIYFETQFHVGFKGKSNSKCLAGISCELEVLLPIEDLVNLHALRSRLQKDLFKAEKEIAILSGRLSKSSFIQKAPEKVISECRQKLADAEAQVDLVQQRLLGLE